MQASLIMFKADGEKREFALTKPSVVIGRKNTCDLRIPLSSVSRQHCQLEQRDGVLYLRDLGSSNGTFHNDTRIMECELEGGDQITVGAVHFTVVIDGVPGNVEPVRTVLPSGAQASNVEEEAAMASGELVAEGPFGDEDLDLPLGVDDEPAPQNPPTEGFEDFDDFDDLIEEAESAVPAPVPEPPAPPNPRQLQLRLPHQLPYHR